MKKRNYILLSVVFLVFAVISLLFLNFVRETMGYRTGVEKADAIVVLTGGKGRVEAGLNLLRMEAAGVLILSGVHEDADIDSIYLKKIRDMEKFKVILEKRSKSTYENAIEVRRLLGAYDIRSLILITSLYHMKRADYIFSRILPPGVRIETYSVSTPNFDESGWWSGNSLVILLTEFVKYYWYVITLNGF
ncbi:MAG: YdcF family protein [Deltaproteobacteria bacterium]|nr:YdcF family protein [Deltaproteobacteria bacterium]